MFIPCIEPILDLPSNGYHIHYKWKREDCTILFSVAQQGLALSCHVASDKQGLRKLKQAINEFCPFIFSQFPWSRMIIAKVDKVNRASIKRVLLKTNFEQVLETKKACVLIRRP